MNTKTSTAQALRERLRFLRQQLRVQAVERVQHVLLPLTERAARGLGLPSRRAMQEARAELERLTRVIDQLEQVVEQVKAAQPLVQQLADEAQRRAEVTVSAEQEASPLSVGNVSARSATSSSERDTGPLQGRGDPERDGAKPDER